MRLKQDSVTKDRNRSFYHRPTDPLFFTNLKKYNEIDNEKSKEEILRFPELYHVYSEDYEH